MTLELLQNGMKERRVNAAQSIHARCHNDATLLLSSAQGPCLTSLVCALSLPQFADMPCAGFCAPRLSLQNIKPRGRASLQLKSQSICVCPISCPPLLHQSCLFFLRLRRFMASRGTTAGCLGIALTDPKKTQPGGLTRLPNGNLRPPPPPLLLPSSHFFFALCKASGKASSACCSGKAAVGMSARSYEHWSGFAGELSISAGCGGKVKFPQDPRGLFDSGSYVNTKDARIGCVKRSIFGRCRALRPSRHVSVPAPSV